MRKKQGKNSQLSCNEYNSNNNATPRELSLPGSIIDKKIAIRLKERRKMLGMSQTKLGETMGISFQQIQKYEKGTSRLTCSRMIMMAKVLDVKMEYFLEGLEEE